MTPEAILERLRSARSYAEYLVQWREHLKTPLTGLDKDARKRLYFIRYNYERHERVAEQYLISDELRAAADMIDAPQMWMLLTEDWCGDSAFAGPVIRAAAQASDHVELRILRRDENLDIMERHLTNGGRSIPKLVAFDMNGQELFSWGPRPASLQQLRSDLLAAGLDAREVSRLVIAWYDEGNWVEIDTELASTIQSSVEPVA